MTGGAEIVEDVALLLPQRISHGEHALDETAACGAVRTEAGVTPQDAVPQGALGHVVGGLNTALVYEGPQGRFDGSQVAARRRRGRVGGVLAMPQRQAQRGPQFADVALEGGSLERAIADPMPPRKQLRSQGTLPARDDRDNRPHLRNAEFSR